ncbi:MAG: hypothetical protein AB7O62_04270 [Pirellulales bacterium]
MDAQQVLTQVKKHHFWIISAIVVVVVTVCWYLAVGTLMDGYKSGAAVIDGKYAQMTKVSGTPNHPNEKFAEGVKAEHAVLQKATLLAWEKLFAEQKEVLVWPEIGNAEFIRVVPNLKPEEEIPARLREQYMNFIRDYIPKEMFAIVDMRDLVEVKRRGADRGGRRPGGPMAGGAAGGALMGGSGQPEGMEYRGLVSWDKNHRSKLLDNYTWRSLPSTKQVRYAQEDLWIYEAMLRVIAKTNEGVTEHMFANVKRINALDLGAEASKAYNSSLKGASSSGMGAALAAAPGAAPGTPGASAAGTAPTSADELLDDLRFVDDKYVPLPAGANPPYAEFKNIPVRFSLIINQNKITDLLAHCANSPLAIEIRRVRVNPGPGGIFKAEGPSMGASSSPTAGGPRGASGPVGAAAKLQASQGGSGRDQARQARGAGGETEISGNDVELEVFGLVYIFNQPDRAKLGAGSETPVVPPADPAAAPVDPAAAPGQDPAAQPAPADDQPAAVPPEGVAPADGAAPADPAAGDAPADDPAADDAATPADATVDPPAAPDP